MCANKFHWYPIHYTDTSEYKKYQGVNEFHILVRMGCCCKIIVFSPLKTLYIISIFGWFKRSLNQSIGSFSTNPHFALFRPDRRSDIFGNVSNHWGMVTYTFFWNNFLGSLIRAHTGSFANVSAGTSPLYIKVGQISELSKNGSWVLVDARRFFF